MRFVLTIILFVLSSPTFAGIDLPDKCEAALPQLLFKPIIKESETKALMNSGDWLQSYKSSRFWTAYSDRSHNTTYESPSVSSLKYSELYFNEEVRIARIEGDFALVYTEKKKGVIYPQISTEAQSRGWIPMKNLLLWNSCPTDDAGIYQKAIVAHNIDDLGQKKAGRIYMNPEIKDCPKSFTFDSIIYLVMKEGDNGHVLLSKECKMDGYTSQVLYGWVNKDSIILWSQRTCLEPNWEPSVVEHLNGKKINIYHNGRIAANITLGRKNNQAKGYNQYRFEPELMRYPILDNNSENENQYCVTAFAFPAGLPLVPLISVGSDYSAASIVEDKMKDKSIINLIVVIDGTLSMENYYQSTQKIIRQAYDYFGKENKTVRVGVVLYRDYTDGQYVTEHLSMRSPTDPSVANFLQSGGKYGVKSSPLDHTLAEALFKGLEVALDTKTMGYSPKNSNLLFVIGDCGNDLNDKRCISQEEIIKRSIANNVQVCAFQVRNGTEQSFQLFRKQMMAIVRENTKAQYAAMGNGFHMGFKELADGFEFRTDLPQRQYFYIGTTRNASHGTSIDADRLFGWMSASLLQFKRAIQAQLDVIGDAKDIVSSEKHIVAFQAYTDKKDPETGLDYWKQVIFISSDEFQQLMEKLQPVMAAAGTGNRKSYVDAMRELTRSMISDITPAEMDNKDVKEIMALAAGLNVKTGSLGGRSLIQIQSEDVVTDNEFNGIIEEFSNKYNKLVKIRENKYPFSIERNKTVWYWIPIEDLP